MTAAGIEASAEAGLIARAQRGEEAAFEALFEAHKRRVYFICLRMIHDAAEAEDLTQEVFIKVFRKISTFRGDAAFSTWLQRLVLNEVFGHLRKKRAQPVFLDKTSSSKEGLAEVEPGGNDLQLEGCVDRITLRRAIAKLPPGYRAAFLLHDVEGYRHSEIARLMNWSVGNSKSLVFKARRRLRRWFCLDRASGTADPCGSPAMTL
jgi:RNA polymerase sigma-70 factor (ECF subfamily)